MPVLPHVTERIATAADSRILESRQLLSAAGRAARALPAHARTLLLKRLPDLLLRRDQDYYACKQHYIEGCYANLNTGPSPGAIVGIVLGSIVGFILVLWVLWVLSAGTTFIQTSALEEDVVVTARRRSRSPGNRSRRTTDRSSYRAEMRETTTRRTSPRRDRVIRQERIVRDVPNSSRRQRDSSQYRERESVVIEESSSRPERRVAGDDMVEVIEEHSSIDAPQSPRRPGKGSRRGSNYRP